MEAPNADSFIEAANRESLIEVLNKESLKDGLDKDSCIKATSKGWLIETPNKDSILKASNRDFLVEGPQGDYFENIAKNVTKEIHRKSMKIAKMLCIVAFRRFQASKTNETLRFSYVFIQKHWKT